MTEPSSKASFRPRRSILYVPASNVRALEKARTLPADGFIVDLEDAVLPQAKLVARAAALELIRAGGGFGPRELIVRINACDSPWAKDDLAALAEVKAPSILIPKVSSPADLHGVLQVLGPHAAAVDLWAMMETAASILSAREIAASGVLTGFVVGTNDLATELRCTHPADRAPMQMALQTCVMAARAYGLAAIDGVHIDLDDDAGFMESCRAGRSLGFDGRSLIHPKQIAGANTAYAPSPAEIDRARRLTEAHSAAAAQGSAVAVVDGRLVEFLHVREAQRILAQAAAIAALG